MTYNNRDFQESRVLHTYRNIIHAHLWAVFIGSAVLVIIEACPNPQVPVAFVAVDSNAFGRARRPPNALATRLVADCVKSLRQPLLHALTTYRLAMASFTFVIS